MIEFTDDNFKEVALNSPVTLVDFWAEWCAPCRKLAPIIEELATEYVGKNVKIGKMDVDANQHTPIEYGIRGIPALVIFQNGEEVDRIVGFTTIESIREKLNQYIVA